MAEFTCRVITHIHSEASNALASPGYDRISRRCREILGPAYDRVHWAECLTTVGTLLELLDGRGPGPRVDLLFATDHMSSRRHLVSDGLIRAASTCPRLGVGAEVATFVSAGPGGWLPAPEVLLYGPAEPQALGGASYYGVSQPVLDELYAACTPDGAPGPDLRRTVRFCLDRRFAYAVSHPLDRHGLPLSDLLELLRLFPFVETVNGGFSRRSARLLSRLIELENQRAHARGTCRPAPPVNGGAPWFQVRHPLGGSDAHLRDLDRVVTLFSAERPDPTAGDFIRAMLEGAADPAAHRARFAPAGSGIGLVALGREVTTLVHRNIVNNRHAVRGVVPTARLLVAAVWQLLTSDRRSRRRHQELASYLRRSG